MQEGKTKPKQKKKPAAAANAPGGGGKAISPLDNDEEEEIEAAPVTQRTGSGMRALILGDDDVVRQSTDFSEIVIAIEQERKIWIELDRRTPFGEKLLEDVLKIHPLAAEDVWNDIGIPKTEEFPEYLQLVVLGVLEEDVAGQDVPLELTELDLVLGDHWVLTHAHDEEVCAIAPIQAEVLRNPRLLKKGTVWVAHAILDRMVDQYLPVIQRFETQVEKVETGILDGSLLNDRHTIMRILRIKRSLQMLRRTTILQREIFLRLSRAEYVQIPPEAVPFYRDIYDHFTRVAELVDNYRDLVGGLLEAHFSMQSNRMNVIMKRLTLISTIMLPLTLIAGIYGMNFRGEFPELDWKWGYYYALGLMASVAIGILWYFKKMKWL